MADKGGRKRKSGGQRRQKIRVDLRRNKQVRARDQNLTQDLLNDDVAAEDAHSSERFSGKGLCRGGEPWSALKLRMTSCCEPLTPATA
ncbi:MAG: hypothetical protein R3C49_20640 [Planctomycetaceae bacterium]